MGPENTSGHWPPACPGRQEDKDLLRISLTTFSMCLSPRALPWPSHTQRPRGRAGERALGLGPAPHQEDSRKSSNSQRRGAGRGAKEGPRDGG